MSGVGELPELVERYEVWLERQPLSERTRREYARQVAGFVEWLGADPARDGETPADSFARDYAVRDFKRHLKLERRWSPASVNLALAPVDHFLRFVGLGAAEVSRERLLGCALGLLGPRLRVATGYRGHAMSIHPHPSTARRPSPHNASAAARLDRPSEGGLT